MLAVLAIGIPVTSAAEAAEDAQQAAPKHEQET
jgi:hypothetical protein